MAPAAPRPSVFSGPPSPVASLYAARSAAASSGRAADAADRLADSRWNRTRRDRELITWGRDDEEYAARDPEAGRADLGDDAHTPVHEFRFKLDKLAARMTTATGRRLAEGRQRTMRAFYEQLEREVAGEE